jgi:hypothetical protein
LAKPLTLFVGGTLHSEVLYVSECLPVVEYVKGIGYRVGQHWQMEENETASVWSVFIHVSIAVNSRAVAELIEQLAIPAGWTMPAEQFPTHSLTEPTHV